MLYNYHSWYHTKAFKNLSIKHILDSKLALRKCNVINISPTRELVEGLNRFSQNILVNGLLEINDSLDW